MALGEDEAAAPVDEEGDLVPCPHCERNFRPEVHAKHVNICVKVFMNKRKVYNTTDHRLPDDPALAQVRKKAAQQAKKGQVGIGQEPEKDKEKKTAWRIKSEAFRAAMKDAKVVEQFKREGRPMSELPPPKMTAPELDDRTQCPHCGRRFGEQQAVRHMPLCAKKGASKPAAKPAARPAQPARAMPKKRNA